MSQENKKYKQSTGDAVAVAMGTTVLTQQVTMLKAKLKQWQQH